MRTLLVLVVFVGLSSASSSGSSSCVVRFNNTNYGVGLYNETFNGTPFCTYLGVRYAEAPVGALRFRNPVMYHPNGPENYTTIGNVCPQEDDIYNFSEVIGDEDCLFMDIYAPKISGSQQYPVLVYVHGGTFMVGSAQNNVANGVDLLVDRGVVVVSINYRLAVLGFLRYPAFNISGNFGLKDQRTALQWVQRYIKYFGGDPNRVTLMGQSAGAGSVTFHLYSESSRGLFQRLFALGGSMLAPWALNIDSQNIGEQMVAQCNISSLEELQELDFNSMVVRNGFDTFGFFSMFYPGFLPAIEDDDDPEAFITVPPHELVLQKPVNQVPILVGHTSTEFELLLFYANFLYVGSNFPNTRNESMIGNITRLISFRAQLARDPNFYKKLANVANLAYPIKRLLKHLSENLENDPIYYFKFEFDGRFGFYKNEFYINRTRGSRYGAVHGDDLGYIFSPYIVQEALANRSEYRREWKVHERTVELVSNFVHYGNPTPKRSKLSQVQWPAFISGNETEPMYLNIDDKFEIRIDRDAEDDYFQLWDPIYQCLYYYECEQLDAMVDDMEQYRKKLKADIADEIQNMIDAGELGLNKENR